LGGAVFEIIIDDGLGSGGIKHYEKNKRTQKEKAASGWLEAGLGFGR